MLECEQRVATARREANGEYTEENTEQDEERIALLLHNGTLVLQMKELKKELESLKSVKHVNGKPSTKPKPAE